MDEHEAEASSVASLAAASTSGSLPPLPAPALRHSIGRLYDADQMRAYAAAVLEVAAQEADGIGDGGYVAAHIRALKP
jgi:hypothetical protein